MPEDSTGKSPRQNIMMKKENDASIILEHVSKTYDGRYKAVNDLSLYVNPGEIVGLIGPNGSGKTTTLSISVGLRIPTTGGIRIKGISLFDNAVLAKQPIGYIPDMQEAIELLTGWEYVNLVAALYGFSNPEIRKRIGKLFKAFGMDAFQHNLVETYSHGMIKKIQIIAALVHQPSVIVFDEPLSGLDIESILFLKSIFQKLKQKGVAFLIATHNLSFAEDICDRVYILEQGRCIANGSPRQIKQDQKTTSLEGAFVKMTKGVPVDEEINEIINHQ